jgi:apolipoprotein N-acyltransferase
MSKNAQTRKSKDATQASTTPIKTRPERLTKTWVLACLAAFFYWLAQPPMSCPWAAYIASGCWVAIIAKECPPTRMEGWHIWIASALMWLALLQGIRLAFWPLYAGWIALSLYLAVYISLFIAMARSLTWTWQVPLPLAAATAWVGCELIRGYFVTGFSACMLAHTQIPWPWMLPTASHFGGYGVSLIVMFIGGLLYQWIRCIQTRTLDLSNSICTAMAVAVIAWSVWSVRSRDQWIASQEPIKPLAAILLIQENLPTQFDVEMDDVYLGWQRYERENELAAVRNAAKGVDLVVWPESTFSGGLAWLDVDDEAGFQSKIELTQSNFDQWKAEIENKFARIRRPYKGMATKFLLGTDVVQYRSDKLSKFNTALWYDPSGTDATTFYAKQHLVMFGEYIPVLSSFPSLLRSIGMGQIEAGQEPMALQLANGRTISPSVCFEDVVPHLIQSHVSQLAAQGKSPDVLINITNDGWFRDSSILDHHLNSAIMVAVENRRPMLVAANLGISAWIDGDGRVVRALPRMKPGSILAEPIPDGRWGLWQSIGDWPARALAVLSALPILNGWCKRRWGIRKGFEL